MKEQLKYAIELTIENGGGSASMLQMKMLIGYNKADKLMEEMENLGVIGPKDGPKLRKLLINSIEEVNGLY